MEASAFVTDIAMMNVAKITGTDELLIRVAPLGEARYKVLADAFTMVAASKITETR